MTMLTIPSRLAQALCALLLFSACLPAVTTAQPQPAVPTVAGPAASPACEAAVLALVPLIVAAAAPGDTRDLWLDLGSFALAAELFCGGAVAPQKIARAVGRPFRDVSGRGLALTGNAGHVRLQALVPLGLYAESVVRVSTARPSGERDVIQFRLTFRRAGNSFELVERKGLSAT